MHFENGDTANSTVDIGFGTAICDRGEDVSEETHQPGRREEDNYLVPIWTFLDGKTNQLDKSWDVQVHAWEGDE